MKTPTHRECAENYRLWEEFVDPEGLDSEEAFDSLTIQQKIEMQVDMFGKEEERA